MKVTLLIKAEAIDQAEEFVNRRIPFACTDSSRIIRLGAVRVDLSVPMKEILAVYKWFNDAPSDAPYPAGTLLWFQVTP